MAKVCDVLAERRPDFEERDQALRDLACVLRTQEGFRVWLRLLRQLGVGRMLDCSPETVAMYNQGMSLMHDAAAASPGLALNLMREVCFDLAIPFEDESESPLQAH